MTKLFLHIGTHKTGTTAIQTFASQHRAELLKRGILYPDYNPFIKKNIHSHHAFARSVKDADQNLSRDQGRALTSHWAGDALINNSSILVSAESISIHKMGSGDLLEQRRNYLSELASWLREFDTTVILVLRRPDEYIRSFYQERVRKIYGTEVPTFEMFIQSMSKHGAMLNYNESVLLLKNIFVDVKCVIFQDLVKTQDIGHNFFNLMGIETTDLSAAGIMRPSLSIPETQIKIFASRYINNAKQNEAFISWMQSPDISNIINRSFSGNKYDLWESHESRMDFFRSRMEDLSSLQKTIGYTENNIFQEPDTTLERVPAIPSELIKLIMDYLGR